MNTIRHSLLILLITCSLTEFAIALGLGVVGEELRAGILMLFSALFALLAVAVYKGGHHAQTKES